MTLNKGSWSLRSEIDDRWNCKGTALNKFLAWEDLLKNISNLRSELGNFPEDLKYSLLPEETPASEKIKEGKAKFGIVSLKDAKPVAGKMRIGEVSINGTVFPIVLQQVVFGFIEHVRREREINFSVIQVKQDEKSMLAKSGFAKLLISGDYFQMYVSVQESLVENIFSSFN